MVQITGPAPTLKGLRLHREQRSSDSGSVRSTTVTNGMNLLSSGFSAAYPAFRKPGRADRPRPPSTSGLGCSGLSARTRPASRARRTMRRPPGSESRAGGAGHSSSSAWNDALNAVNSPASTRPRPRRSCQPASASRASRRGRRAAPDPSRAGRAGDPAGRDRWRGIDQQAVHGQGAGLEDLVESLKASPMRFGSP